MSGMTNVNFYTTISDRLMRWLRLCLLPGLLLARAALGTDALYQNDGFVDYEGVSGTYPLAIDAANFVNNGTFTINWNFIVNTTVSPDNYLYETANTVNYTNNRLMSSDIGFVFDTQTTNVIPRQMAGTFYNPGEVQSAYGFSAWATNIVNPGAVDVPGFGVVVNPSPFNPVSALGGFVEFTGQTVDLTGGTISILGGQGIAQAAGILGMIGRDTNSDWDATIVLGPTFAYPSLPVEGLLPPSQGGLGFPNMPLNTTPYFDIAEAVDTSGAALTNTIIYRAVFLQDSSLDISHNVYFDSPVEGSGGATATIEWQGHYVDPATGIAAVNYLYLNDDYLQSIATNDPNVNGIPLNFTFAEPAPLSLGTPAPAGFNSVFLPGYVSNRFAYVNAQLIATSADTNDIPNHSITNLPARIRISASRELNLTQTQITQPDILSLQSTNQFDGNAGCRIAAPYTDLNLGVTNGFLTISNLQPQSFPVWSGAVQAWSTRWTVLATNTIITISNNLPVFTNSYRVTNDYRVEIVSSQLTPTTPGKMRGFILHSTNSVVLSDAYNVDGTLSIDARSLTLTTNLYGGGARSADGELNLISPNILWPSSLPNLLWLTNNGAISTLNLANFGSRAQPYGAFVNSGRVSDLGGCLLWAQDFENYGTFFSGNSGFNAQTLTTTMTNGSIVSFGSLTINADSLVASNSVLNAGAGLNLTATNLLTDTGTASGNFWQVGSQQPPSASPGSYFINGFNLPRLPAAGDLLGTTVTSTAPAQVVLGGVTNFTVTINNLWAGADYGASNSGYTNNVAVGHLILDAQGRNSVFKFNGTGASNAIYVDRLDLLDYASYTNHNAGGNLLALAFNTNLVIYYADAVAAGAGLFGTTADVSEQINHKNGDHLRWVPTYAGYFSSTNLVFAGVTNPSVNLALARSQDIDSDGDGIANAFDPTPFFQSSMTSPVVISNLTPSGPLAISWNSIPNATNFVVYSTSGDAGSYTNLLTNFSTNNAGPFTMSNFISPIPYPSPPARVMIFTPVPGSTQLYWPVVSPWLTYPY
jgi:hypothetical protein